MTIWTENRSLAAVYERAQANSIAGHDSYGDFNFFRAREICMRKPMLCDDVGIDYPNLVVHFSRTGREATVDERGVFFPGSSAQKTCTWIFSGIPPQETDGIFSRESKMWRTKFCGGTDWPGPGVPEIKGNIEKFNALSDWGRSEAQDSI